MNKKETIIYKGHKLQFWSGSWDVYDREGKYVVKCFRYLEDARAYINSLKEE